MSRMLYGAQATVEHSNEALHYVTVECPNTLTVVVRGSSDAAVYSTLLNIKRANRRYNCMKDKRVFLQGGGHIEGVIARKLPPSFIARAFRRFELFSKKGALVLDDVVSKGFMIKAALVTVVELVSLCRS